MRFPLLVLSIAKTTKSLPNEGRPKQRYIPCYIPISLKTKNIYNKNMQINIQRNVHLHFNITEKFTIIH